MKTIHFAFIGAALLALAACGGREEDALTNAEDNQVEELNALADNAAMDAENEALGNAEQQIEINTVEETNTDEGVTTEPSEVEDDVQGM